VATRKKKKKAPKKTYRFQLTLPGIAGITVVCLCLFLWMFLLGIWAGQTFLLPSAKPGLTRQSGQPGEERPVETLAASAKKKPAETSRK